MTSESKPGDSSRRTFLKIGGGLVVGAIIAAAATDALLGGKIATSTSTSTETTTETGPTTTVTGPLTTSTTTVTGPGSTSTTTVTGPTSTVTSTVTNTSTSTSGSSTTQAFQILSIPEQAELVAIASAIIPTDSNGPGAKEAGVAYFIDNMLNGEYGNDGNAYTKGPWVEPNTQGSITVNGTTYGPSTASFQAGGTTYTVNYPTTTDVRIGTGERYQYPLLKKDFWRVGLDGIELYSNAAYGGNFETLSAANQAQVLTDLWNNKPTAAQFQNIQPADFAYELFYLVWAGFLMDPMYGGNQGMVGWMLTGFNGVNTGNFYGEGYTSKQLMVATTPVRLKPVSLGQFQQAALGGS